MSRISNALIDTEDILADERVIEMADELIVSLPADVDQFATMLATVCGKANTNKHIDWFEAEYQPRMCGVTEDTSKFARHIQIDNHRPFQVDDLVHVVSTGDALIVTGVALTRLRVKVAYGERHPIRKGDHLMVIGSMSD